jgi:hypothetical protein
LGYDGKLKIGTNINNIIWSTDYYIANDDLPKAIQKMRVYSFWVKDGALFIKVYRNNKLIKKLENETNLR